MFSSHASTKWNSIYFQRLPGSHLRKRPSHAQRCGFRAKVITRPSSTQATIGEQNPATYCRDFVRRHDRDAYLTSLFYPRHLQEASLAVKAFYLELAMIPDSVSNATIGAIRMQFWRDAIRGIFEGRPPHHPIALALHDASKIAKIQPYHLKRIVDARDSEMKSPVHMTLDSLLSHAESTSSTLNYLLLSILDLHSDKLLHAASHLGTAQTIAILLRALPYHASKGLMVIPASITAKHHVIQEDVFRRGPDASGIDDAVYEFAVVANDHLLTAREMFKDESGRVLVPNETMPAFLAAIPTTHYLKRLEATNFNAFEPSLQLRDNIRLSWLIWKSSFLRTF